MGKSTNVSAKPVYSDPIYIDELHEGSVGPLTVMLCRKWDVISINNKYISTDYIMSDKKGNVIHCFAKSFIAHRFKHSLEEGCLYSLKGFNVVPNAEKYRILKDAQYMIELQGSTLVRKATDDAEKYNRYPFQLVSFEGMTPTENKYFIDVIGYVTSVGDISRKSSGSQTIEFNLTNERGYQLMVTLWGELAEDMLERKKKHHGAYTLIMSSMIAKEYLGNMCLSSCSSTLLLDNEDIPAIKSFKSAIMGAELVDTGLPHIEIRPTLDNLKQLLEWGRTRGRKERAAFRNTVRITNIRTKNSWFNYTCSLGKCRKALNPNHKGVFWCESCNSEISYPRPRYRVQVDVTDGTADVVVVLFDEVAEKLLGRTTQALLTDAEQDETGDAFVMPPVLRSLIGTSHVFEIRSQTYYQVADYESFNCSRVILPDSVHAEKDHHVVKSDECGVVSEASSSTLSKNVSPISTPVKTKECNKSVLGDGSDDDNLNAGGGGDDVASYVLHGRKRGLEYPESDVAGNKSGKSKHVA